MLEVDGITVSIEGATVVDGAALAAPVGQTTTVMGPSGCGKTTLLRVIAGLQRADAGTVRWNGRTLDPLAPHERPVGLMFQDFALFPHRSVAENIGFGLRMVGMSRTAIASRVDALLELVGLPGFHDRDVARLSGGEQQRVALARALAPEPEVLMLDEPLGSLDGVLRDRLLDEMRAIFENLRLTVVYVTHDKEEAFAVADQLVVMDRGSIVRAGAPEDVWQDPQNAFTARFLGFDDVFPAHISAGVARLPFAEVPVSGSGTGVVLQPGAVRVGSGGDIAGRVVAMTYRGGAYEMTVEVSGGHIVHADAAHRVAAGTNVRLSIDPARIVTID